MNDTTKKSPTQTTPTPATQAAIAAQPAPEKATPLAQPAASKPAAKPAATPVAAKPVAVKKPAAPKAAPAPKAAEATKPAKAEKAEKPAKLEKPAKPRKVKLVRDSFAMPETEYAQIALIKKRLGGEFKKSEVLRAGLALLAALGDDALKVSMGKIERIKTGRPSKK